MQNNSLIFLMGTPAGGLQDIVRTLSKITTRLGAAFDWLSDPLAVKTSPVHEKISYWKAVRRYFDDFGLPPIAPVPQARISAEARQYYIGLFARTLGNLLGHNVEFCADRLAVLVLDLLYPAVSLLGCPFEGWFFFRNPMREMLSQLGEKGVPPQLTEFIWRNMATQAALAPPETIRLIDVETLDQKAWERIMREIAGPDPITTPLLSPPPYCLETRSIECSPLTMHLYEALRRPENHEELRAVAQNVASRQSEQNGWQFANCLDSGEIAEYSRRLLAHSDAGKCPNAEEPADSDSGLANFMDQMERRLMDAHNDYEARLFLCQQSLAAWCRDQLNDGRMLLERKLASFREKNSKLAKRRKERLRKLFDKVKKQ